MGCTIDHAKKQLAKLGEVQNNGQEYWVDYQGYTISFLRNGGGDRACCYHVKRTREQNEPQSDYYPGSYFKNITKAIAWAKQAVSY